jgi:hypothetical protein
MVTEQAILNRLEFSKTLKENKKIPKEESIPNGWIRGRSRWNAESREAANKNKPNLKLKNKEMYLKKITDMYDEFMAGEYQSVTDYWESKNIKITLQGLCHAWKTHIPEYRDNVRHGISFKETLNKS